MKINYLLVCFDDRMLPYISSITGKDVDEKKSSPMQKEVSLEVENKSHSSAPNIQTPKNLELLYNVKLRLSVRLGTKVVLLKDILSWDIGEIIELEQMVNEPLEILVNGIKIGEGEAVIVEGKFGLKIKSIGDDNFKLNQIGL